MFRPAPSPRENWILGTLFAAALAYSVFNVTYHWQMGFLAGSEFRQAQTALISHYIDQQNNFSLLYETPVLGKPWISILLEVPIYEWTVVLLARTTGMPHFIAARTVSAACFYLTLPAVYFLLGRFALPKPRRLLILAVVLCTPVYIFYSRAFLMDSMALMCCVWFLFGFVRTMDERRWTWLTLTTVFATAAALIKSATLAVWLPPAAAYGAWMLWRDIRHSRNWFVPVHTALWGVATIAVALGALRWWIAYTDPIKEAHPSAWIFTSKNLSQGNWGLFDLKAIFSTQIWRLWFQDWNQAILSPWAIGLALAGGLLLPTVRWPVLTTSVFFFLAQFLFPFAYALQDYYYYSCALFLNVALGFVLVGLLDSRAPRWGTATVFAAIFAAQIYAYWRDYRVQQSVVFDGDLPYAAAIRNLTPRNSVIVVAGADWGAMAPYYSQRRALMIRNGLEFDLKYLRRAFADLNGEEVSALVLVGPLRTNATFLQMAAAQFDLEARVPTFSFRDADIYIPRSLASQVRNGVKDRVRYPELSLHEVPKEDPPIPSVSVSSEQAHDLFAAVTPSPDRMRFQWGAGRAGHNNGLVIMANPDSDLWLPAPERASEILWTFGIFPTAYARPEAATDGVEFIVTSELPDGQSRRIYHRVLDPMQNPADRGDQRAIIPYRPTPGERLHFSTRPYGNPAYDWSYWVGIEVR